jgi:hypothetical protein
VGEVEVEGRAMKELMLTDRLRHYWRAWGCPTDPDICVNEECMALDCNNAAISIDALTQSLATAEAERATLAALVESLQNRWASRPLSDPDMVLRIETLEAERARLIERILEAETAIRAKTGDDSEYWLRWMPLQATAQYESPEVKQ